jgi:L-rhamnose isomerase
VLEYKFFEPAFYHTDVPDWGTSYAQVSALGDKAIRSAWTPATTRPAPTSSSS